MFSSGSRGFRILDPTVDRAHQLLHERPGSVSMRLEEALELLPDEGGTELLVMELATGGERTIDGIADGERVVLGHPKTREAMRAGLAMYFVTLADDELMEIADRIVREFAIEWFFNIQLVGDRVIEINPRISTIVYQEDLNLPWLGVKRALGEVSDERARGNAHTGPAGANRASILRSGGMGRVMDDWDTLRAPLEAAWRRRRTSTRSRTPSTPRSSSRPRPVSRRTSSPSGARMGGAARHPAGGPRRPRDARDEARREHERVVARADQRRALPARRRQPARTASGR